ncbi:hypothetical protein [Xenorhabdus siamensis]|uniref:hypothetical protein n=1 Tax=Xenorhabdus siamensis TaxID=3136254 RepID=UPI0030F43E58
MSKRVYPLLSDRKFVERLRVMMQALTDTPLSAEGKAVAAHSFCSGIIQEISTVIQLKRGGIILDEEFLYELVISGWGKTLGQYIDIKSIEGFEVTDHETLRLTQLAIRTGSALFAIYYIIREGYQRFYISIHHALADEHTLMIIRDLVQVASAGGMDLALHNMRQGRQLYNSYVERQLIEAKDDSVLSMRCNQTMTPLRLSETGRLAWSIRAKRITLHRIVQIEPVNNEKKQPTEEVILKMLCNTTNVVREGNTVCSSHNWRLSHESRAVGMMTGLLAIPFGWKKYAPYNLKVSLEACARHSSVFREALACCRASELFINGAVSRGIPASQVISSTFPVGIEIKHINPSEIRLEIEGTLCSRAAVADLLNELTDVLSNRRKQNG